MDGPIVAPPQDTGEAYGLPPARLTITFGFGPGDVRGCRRQRPVRAGGAAASGAAHAPPLLRRQPRPGDDRAATSASRRVRTILRSPSTRSATWPGSPSGPPRSGGRSSASDVRRRPAMPSRPRATCSVSRTARTTSRSEHDDLVNEFVWVGSGDDANSDWLAGGSYLVARRIKMQIETWDRTPLGEQEGIIGRDKKHGAPLSGGDEFATPDFEMIGALERADHPCQRSRSCVPPRSERRHAHPAAGIQLHRRHHRSWHPRRRAVLHRLHA